jgi:rSAM/selenodomain-associated transferase 1
MKHYLYPDARILVFSKAPRPGHCKTRLIPTEGTRGAARIQRCLMDKTVAMALHEPLAPVELWCSPTVSHPAFLRWRAQWRIPLRAQAHGHLGRRMGYALRRTLRGARQAVIIGTDCPALHASHLKHALNALPATPPAKPAAVFCPAEDGGYVLVGVNANMPALFNNIQWGSASVMRSTRRNIKHLGIRHTELASLWDVDTPADLRRARALNLLEY